MTRCALFGCLALLVAGCSVDVTEESTADQSRGGLTGAPPSDAHPGVVLLHLYQEKTVSTCTGELIAPRVVLTAAHCFAPDTKVLRVIPGHDGRALPLGGEEGLGASRAIVHEKFNGDPRNGFDIALIQLDAPLTSFVSIPRYSRTPQTTKVSPLGIRRTPIAITDIGRRVELVGYGKTIQGIAGILEPGGDLGQKHVGTATINDVLADRIMVGGFAEQCPGDSGGPVLESVNGEPVIVGISSYSDVKVGERRCSRGMNTRIDAHLLWLDEKLAKLQ
jgi:secreted trypsin-like serine protease